MSISKLQNSSFQELKKIADKMDLPHKRSKKEMMEDIENALKEYEEYKIKKLDKYTKHEQLGEKGKEGTTFRVTTKSGKEYAMKTFRPTKSSDRLKREYTLQKKASKYNICPRVVDYDTVSKYIVMERMEGHLIDLIIQQKGLLYKYQQQRIIEIFKLLDEAQVFHNDANLCNYMIKNKEIYIIDFGFAKEITPSLVKSLNTSKPNMKLMLIGFVLKLKEMGVNPKSYEYMKKYISSEDLSKFKI